MIFSEASAQFCFDIPHHWGLVELLEGPKGDLFHTNETRIQSWWLIILNQFAHSLRIPWGLCVLRGAPWPHVQSMAAMARLAHAGAFVLLNYLWAKRFSSSLRVGWWEGRAGDDPRRQDENAGGVLGALKQFLAGSPTSVSSKRGVEELNPLLIFFISINSVSYLYYKPMAHFSNLR